MSEAEVGAAMRFAFPNLRIVAEPGGAVALAALLAGKVGDVPDGSVIVVSGGNVDPALFAGISAASNEPIEQGSCVSAMVLGRRSRSVAGGTLAAPRRPRARARQVADARSPRWSCSATC